MAEQYDLAAKVQLIAQAIQQQCASWLAEPRESAVDVISRGASESGRRRKKPTYYVRKEEIKSLQLQIDALQARLQTLEEAKTLGISTTDLGEPSNSVVHTQQYSIASVQSALGDCLNKIDRLPHEVTICLGKDRAKRHVTLIAMKDKKLEDSQRYLAERTRFLDPMAPHVEACRYVESSGAFCSMYLDVTQFEGAKSARQVFDALKFFFINMEISISELIAFLAIREDDGAWHDGIFESRIVSNATQDVQIEMNTATFSAFYDQHDECGGGRPFGVIASDSVSSASQRKLAPESTKTARQRTSWWSF